MRDRDLNGITYIRIVSLEQQAAEREAERFRDLWEGNDRDYLPPPFRSIPIKVWALLKCGPLNSHELAEELSYRDGAVRQGVFDLRRRGQRIVNLPGKYHDRRKYQLLPGPPLKIIESPRGLTLLPLSGRVRANEVVIELR
jgi:hypothetical protein